MLHIASPPFPPSNFPCTAYPRTSQFRSDISRSTLMVYPSMSLSSSFFYPRPSLVCFPFSTQHYHAFLTRKSPVLLAQHYLALSHLDPHYVLCPASSHSCPTCPSAPYTTLLSPYRSKLPHFTQQWPTLPSFSSPRPNYL